MNDAWLERFVKGCRRDAIIFGIIGWGLFACGVLLTGLSLWLKPVLIFPLLCAVLVTISGLTMAIKAPRELKDLAGDAIARERKYRETVARIEELQTLLDVRRKRLSNE